MTTNPAAPTAANEPSALNLPNALTLLRVLMVPAFAWVFLSHPDTVWWRIAATVIFLVAIATDVLDGKIARRYGLVTRFGKLMDPIADKALMGTALIGLSLLDLLPWWVTVVILIREVGITLMRFVVINRGVIPASRGGKLKTVLQAVGLSLLIAPLGGVLGTLGLWVMYVAVVVTVVTGIDYLRHTFARSALPEP